VPRITRDAEVTWEGSSAKGRGSITAASSGAFAGLPYSEPSRIAAADATETSPEELLAAAHAACFAMSLAAELTRDRTPPERLDVRATVVVDDEGQGHRVVASELEVRARVRGSDDAAFADATRRADAGCTFSALVRASATVAIDATLEVS
jgi:osmotically inducible protein OsmC